MGILTDQISFTGTPVGADVIHIVDVSDTTDNPAGTSYKIPLSGLSSYFVGVEYWTSGSTGTNSIQTITNTSSGNYSTASGRDNIASGHYSFVSNLQNTASGNASHAEGAGTIASGTTSHAEGNATIAGGSVSHAEGWQTQALGDYTHAGGFSLLAGGIIASGRTSFTHFEVDTANTYGTMSNNSAILGGKNHLLTNTATNSVILGGSGITGMTSDMVYVPDLHISNCPAYADDTAAGVGGLTLGMVYQTTGLGAAPLNVAGILMIKQ